MEPKEKPEFCEHAFEANHSILFCPEPAHVSFGIKSQHTNSLFSIIMQLNLLAVPHTIMNLL